MNDFKSRIKKATEKYLIKNDPNRIKRKNASPERDLQREVIKWLNSIGWSVENIESKAQFSQKMGRYISQPNTPGLPDIIGSDDKGHAVFIELKALGKRLTIRDNQRLFLTRKIEAGCFAIVADSLKYILKTYATWMNSSDRKNFLLQELPKQKPESNEELFPQE